MNILLVTAITISGVVLYEALLNAYTNLHKSDVEEKLACLLHDWSHDHNDELVCVECNYKAGDNV